MQDNICLIWPGKGVSRAEQKDPEARSVEQEALVSSLQQTAKMAKMLGGQSGGRREQSGAASSDGHLWHGVHSNVDKMQAGPLTSKQPPRILPGSRAVLHQRGQKLVVPQRNATLRGLRVRQCALSWRSKWWPNPELALRVSRRS